MEISRKANIMSTMDNDFDFGSKLDEDSLNKEESNSLGLSGYHRLNKHSLTNSITIKDNLSEDKSFPHRGMRERENLVHMQFCKLFLSFFSSNSNLLEDEATNPLRCPPQRLSKEYYDMYQSKPERGPIPEDNNSTDAVIKISS